MAEESRIRNSKRNIIVSILYFFISYFLKFFSRSIISKHLGTDYLGLSNLFASVISLLNMAELGFSGAIVFSMYKPLAENDEEKVKSLLNYYKKIYDMIGTVVLIVGLLVTPFIPKIIKDSYPLGINIYLLYVLYLISTASSYFLFAYKTSLLEAAQRVDVIKKIYSLVEILQNIFQAIALVAFKNYYIFVIIQIVSIVIKNILVNEYTKKYYPNLYCEGTLSEETKNGITKRVNGLLVGRICGISDESLSSIAISSFMGLIPLAIYGNYMMVFNGLSSLIVLIRSSMQGSIGNSVATESIEKNYEDLFLWQFFFSIISTVCASCLMCLYQPFITLWMGKEMLLDMVDVSLICFLFFITSVQHAFYLFLTGTGLWWRMKNIYLLNTIANVLLNFILIKQYQLTGIIMVRLISSLVFGLIWQCSVILKNYFKKSSFKYLLYQAMYFIVALIVSFISYFINIKIICLNYGNLIIKGFVCVATTLIQLYFIFFKTAIYQRAIQFAKRVIKS